MELKNTLTNAQLIKLRKELTELSGIPAEWTTPEDIAFELQVISVIDEVLSFRNAENKQGGAV